VIIVAQLSPGDPRVEKDGQRKSFRVQTRSIEYSSCR
jgi:hypothetical protein